jgi:uncharacterized Zn-binding protein involved in type VI secretion
MPAAGRLGDKAQVSMDAHGCPGCPHVSLGPAVCGSPTVNINGRPALRVNDPGIHAACCGPNTWTAIKGSPSVFINGRPAHRMNDATRHCGGVGQLIEGSPNVFIGDQSGALATSPKERKKQEQDWIAIELIDDEGEPCANERYVIVAADGSEYPGRLDERGRARVEGIPSGAVQIRFPELRDDAWS